MNTRKAMHRAATRSLDGHIRFLIEVGGCLRAITLGELPSTPAARIVAAYDRGKLVTPR
ncbi:hypothetical protein [Burkholderia ubonensis]|uniref:hypothetical protein n=1 Tax=Burkholderia ubonensis TaxID=101571 RepID=UPI0012FB5EB0|nr:hypothetical protein [Burkholderia ubonensis]